MTKTDRARQQIQSIVQAKHDITIELIKLTGTAAPDKALEALNLNISASEKFRAAITNLQNILDEIDRENERG